MYTKVINNVDNFYIKRKQNNYQPQEESLNFSEEKLDEEINSEVTEGNVSEGLNLNFDFDDNVQEEDNQQAQLGIF